MEKVRQGEAVSIKAATWNSFIDAAEFASNAKRLVGALGVRSGVTGNMVLVRNTGDATLPRFGALVLSDALIAHDAASDELESEIPAFDGVIAEEESGEEEEPEKDVRPFVVAVEPIPAGEIGRALALGFTPAKVDVVNEEDACAEPVPGSSTGALRSTNIGYARIAWKESGTGEKWCFLRLGAAEPRADDKSIGFAVRDPESASAEEEEDAAKTENLEIKGFCSKDAEEETLGDILSKKDEPKTGPEEDEPEDEVIVRSGDRKKVKFMKIGRGASSVEVDDVSVDFTKADPESEGSDERTNKIQVFGFDSQAAEGTRLADHLAEQDVECEDEVVVRATDRKSLKYIRIGGRLATVLEAGENVTLVQNGNVIVISAEGGAEPGDFVTSGYTTTDGDGDVEIAAIRYYEHQLQVRKAVKVYENGLLKTRVLGDWETFTTAVEETV